MPTMIPVASRNLSAVGYENRRLYVRFHNGTLYYYINVPEQVFRELLNAPSKGVYLARFIRGKYPYHRVA